MYTCTTFNHTCSGKYVQWQIRAVANTCSGKYVQWQIRAVAIAAVVATSILQGIHIWVWIEVQGCRGCGRKRKEWYSHPQQVSTKLWTKSSVLIGQYKAADKVYHCDWSVSGVNANRAQVEIAGWDRRLNMKIVWLVKNITSFLKWKSWRHLGRKQRRKLLQFQPWWFLISRWFMLASHF